jgi:signal transduction histidine kinase
MELGSLSPIKKKFMATKKESKKPRRDSVKSLQAEVDRKFIELSEINRKLKRKIFDLYTIFELSRNFNAVLNYETLLDSFVLTSMGQMGAPKAALYLPLEIGKKEFHLARTKGSQPFPKEELIIDPEGRFGKYIAALNRPVLVEGIARKFANSDDIGFATYFPSGLVIPLIFQIKLRGVLVLSQKASGQLYQDDDIEFLSILANQTAVSIENARLYESEMDALNKLQKAQELLLQSERLAALGELSAKIAHEVNNPLGIIKNYLELLKNCIDMKPKSSEYLDIVGQELDRIALIIRQLLDFHRPRVIKFIKTDIIKIVNEALALMSHQMEDAKVRMTLKSPQRLSLISAWPDGLKQVFINLLLNSKDAMKNGGEILIDISQLKEMVRIRLTDNGHGIAPVHIPHIFEPFYTTKEAGSGTGLGLSVCYGIIKNHNGSIEYCDEGKGSCFEITLPIEQKDVEYDWRI